MPAFAMKVETASLKLVQNELKRNAREFEREERDKMRRATNLERRVVRQEIRALQLVDTGRLLKAIRRRIIRLSPGNYEGVINFGGRRAKHGRQFLARFHEYGTVKMRATPFLALSLERTIDEIEKTLGEAHKVWLR